jgi:hypothetical protein
LRELRQASMTRTGLSGPFRLTIAAIEAAVLKTSAGVYAIGHADGMGRFCVSHVGRDDQDVRAKLRSYVGSDMLFKFAYYHDGRAAFEKECQLFHDISPPRNRVHPDRPRGTTLTCPGCRIYQRA